MKSPRPWVIALVFLFANASFAESIDHWTLRATNPVNSVRYCNDRFVAVGPAGAILTSFNGDQWTAQTSGTNRDLYGVTFAQMIAGGYFVAVGANTILVSQDATNWTSLSVANCQLFDVAFSGTTLVAVGRPAGPSPAAPNVMYCTSAAPTNWWSKRISFARDCFGTGATNTVANFSRLVYGGGQFVAVGDICTGIWTSFDGQNWSNRGLQGSQYFSGIAYGNGRLVAVGREGDPVVSTNNGASWSMYQVHSTYSYYYFIDDICFASGRFVAPDGSGSILSSVTGTNWFVRNGMPRVESIAFGAGTFVAGWPYGGIYRSDPVGAPLAIRAPTNSPGPELSIALEPGIGQTVGVQRSSNLLHWAEIWRGTNTGSALQFIDSSTAAPAGFYRAVTP